MEFKTYTRRSDNSDLGREYEIKITTLLALRSAFLPDTQCMWLGGNVDNVGDFDDVVLCRKTTPGKYIAYLLQLKHQQNPKQITENEFLIGNQKDNFLLSKYYTSYVNLKKLLDSEEEKSDIINYLKKCDEIHFILYTNKLATENEILKRHDDQSLDFITTCPNGAFKFTNVNNLGFDVNFWNQLILFANQSHANDLDGLIEAEVKRYVRQNAKNVAQNFTNYITTWCKFHDSSFTLTKLDVVNKITSLALEQHVVQFPKENFTFYDCPIKKIWNEIMSTCLTISVDFDSLVVDFLKCYLGSEIGKYVKTGGRKKWGDHLPRQDQVQFLNTFLNVNLKVVKKDERLTLFEAYQHLWLCQKLPMLIEANTEEDLENIVYTLKAVESNLRVVIIKNSKFELSNVTASLQDLSSEVQKQILSQKVKLQGRSSVYLKDVLTSSMFSLFKCKDIIYVLNSAYNIGSSYEDLPELFIEQKLSKVYLKFKILKELKKDLFLIENFSDLSIGDYSNVVSFDQNDDIEPYGLSQRDTHRMVYYNNFYIQWKNTFGSVKNARDYKNEFIYEDPNNYPTNFKLLTPEKLWNSLDQHLNEQNRLVQIISANAGMGKSVLMNLIASKTPTDVWVLKINLNEYEDYYLDLEQQPVLEQLKFLNDKILEKSFNIDLGQTIFNAFLEKKKVLILLDGFDEIALLFKSQITLMASRFAKDGWPLWITTRPVMAAHLEDAFSTFSFTLRPFTLKNREDYLRKYFKKVLDPGDKESVMVEFIREILDSAKNNFDDTDCNFTGVPLQTKFIGDVFVKDYKRCILTSKVDFNKNLDLLFLYEEFSKNKTEILCEKYGKDAKRTRILFKKYQELYAVSNVVPKAYLKGFNLEVLLEKYSEDKDEEMQFLQREGVLVLNQYLSESKYKFNVKFVHLTYAEFLVSQWFVDNLNNDDSVMKKTIKAIYEWRFEDSYNLFLFKMIDRIVAKDSPTHLAIINNQMEKINFLDKAIVDKAGRTPLHLLALNGIKHRKSNVKILDNLVNFVDLMPHDVNVKDKILFLNPLEYSLKNLTLAIANRICKSFCPSLSLDFSNFRHYTYINYCSLQGYSDLFKKLVPHYSGRSLLLELEKQDLTVDWILHKCDFKTNVEFVHELGVNRVLDLFKSPQQTQNIYSDPRFAVSFGDVANVEFLLDQKIDVNETDCDGNTLLYYATTFKKLSTLKLLISNGAQVNKPCSKGNTALHVACGKGFDEFVTELLQNAADVNQPNDLNQTPIGCALLRKNYEIVQQLQENGARLNVEDSNGSSLLHYAAETGSNDFIIKYLIEFPLSVNKQNRKGETPLLLATKNKKLESVKILFLNEASATKATEDGYTPLHFAAEEGFYEIAVEILTHNVDVNKQNKNGETPLISSLKYKRYELALLLVYSGADCNIGDNDGYVPLHCAIEDGRTDCVALMMAKGAFLNKKSRFDRTPLHLAVSHYNSIIFQVLISCDIDFDAKDSFGNTSLYYASELGYIDFIDELLTKGVDINAKNNLKMTPLHSAIIGGQIEAAEFLLSKGANWDTAMASDRTTFHLVSKYGQTGLMLCFITQGAEINKKDGDGNTPLHLVACEEHLDAAKIIISHKAVLNDRNYNGKTPLHLAVENKIYSNMFNVWKYEECLKVVELLLEKGADVNVRDNYGNTALHYVCVLKDKPFELKEEETKTIMDNFYLPVATLLLENGIDVSIKNIERKTALQLASKANYESLVVMLDGKNR